MSEVNPWSVIQLIAEKKILEAQEEGAFENLPGRGKPLQLEDLSHVPQDLRMAYKILSNAGCLPPELQERKEISRLLDLLEDCEDEHERLAQMQKLRFMLQRSSLRFHKDIRLEQDDPYYNSILERMNKKASQK